MINMDENNISDSLLLLDSALPRPAISSKSSEMFSFSFLYLFLHYKSFKHSRTIFLNVE
jgi:hypothetical protein